MVSRTRTVKKKTKNLCVHFEAAQHKAIVVSLTFVSRILKSLSSQKRGTSRWEQCSAISGTSRHSVQVEAAPMLIPPLERKLETVRRVLVRHPLQAVEHPHPVLEVFIS